MSYDDNLHPYHSALGTDEMDYTFTECFTLDDTLQSLSENSGYSGPGHVVLAILQSCGFELPDRVEDEQDFYDWIDERSVNSSRSEVIDKLLENLEGHHVFPIYKYSHGGVAYSMASFSCPWDSGTVGFAVVKKQDGVEAEKVKSDLHDKMKYLTEWANGNVYLVTVGEETVGPIVGYDAAIAAAEELHKEQEQ